MAKQRRAKSLGFKTVARIQINRFGFPIDWEVEGHPYQKVLTGEQVEVWLPLMHVNGNWLPPLSINIQVRKKKDERVLQDIVNQVYELIPEYQIFWEKRRKEIESGIYLS